MGCKSWWLILAQTQFHLAEKPGRLREQHRATWSLYRRWAGQRHESIRVRTPNDLKANGDPKHIRAVVVLTDGQDNESSTSLGQLIGEVGGNTEEGGGAIKVFTIAFGGDADKDGLKRLAEASGGKSYSGDPQTIKQVYGDIATFF